MFDFRVQKSRALGSLTVEEREDVGGFMPGVVLRGVRVRCVSDGGIGDQPALRSDCLLRSLRTFTDRIVDSQGGCRSSDGENSL